MNAAYKASLCKRPIRPLIVPLIILMMACAFAWSGKPVAVAHSTTTGFSKSFASARPMMMQMGGQCIAPSFSGPTHFSIDTSPGAQEAPIYLVAGDFNNDTILDLATANGDTANISVLLGNGSGGFTALASFTVGTNPFALAVGDFNEDTNLDLAVTNFGAGNVSVLLGNGTGNFGAATNFTVGTQPTGIAVGDFNEDNNLDLIVANFGSGNVSLLAGNGMGSFSAAVNFTVGSGPFSIVVADFNNNNDIDVAVANAITNNVSVLLGNGAGSFSAAVNFLTGGTGPASIAAADVNNNTQLDLVVANQASNNISVLLGNGAGSFGAGTTFPVGGNNPFAVGLGDFNFDGNLDAVTANTGSDTVSVLLGNGMGAFGAATLFNLAPGGDDPRSIVVSNLDANSSLDVATANAVSDNVSVFLNSCSPPTITAVAIARERGAPVSNSIIASVIDAEDDEDDLVVTVNGGTTATVSGVTVSNIVVSPAGVVTADVVASCMATLGDIDFTLRVTDSEGNFDEDTLTVTVMPDVTPPQITCPAPVIGVSGTITYADPTVTDNCPGATFVCSPPSGSVFPVGSTTVTCTATDAAGNTAQCSFAVATFDVCLEDDSQPLNVLLFRSTTGDYIFCCSNGMTFTGKGKVTKKGNTYSLSHNTSLQRVQATATLGTVNKGNASVQSTPGAIKCTIADTNTANNTCNCGN